MGGEKEAAEKEDFSFSRIIHRSDHSSDVYRGNYPEVQGNNPQSMYYLNEHGMGERKRREGKGRVTRLQ